MMILVAALLGPALFAGLAAGHTAMRVIGKRTPKQSPAPQHNQTPPPQVAPTEGTPTAAAPTQPQK